MHQVPLVPPPEPPPAKKQSSLKNMGLGLIVLSLFSRPLSTIATGLDEGTTRGLLLISTDLLRLCFFVGLTLVIIGVLQTRKKQ